MAVAECSNNTGPPVNLFHDPLEWIVGSDLLPVDVKKGVVRGAIAQAIGRPKSTVWRANSPTTGCRAGATRRGSKEIEPYGPSLSTGSRKGGPPSTFQANSRAETNLPCGPWVARRSTPLSTEQASRPSGMALSHAPAQTPPPAPIETFARYHQGSRLHPPTAQEGRRQNRGRFSVLHERKSRVTLAARLAGKTAAETISVMLAVFARSQPALRKSITFDNDTAFAQHAMLRTMRAMTTWFCDAHASWQKGRIENVNGRLRR